jgi:anti-repressor protein
MQTKNSGYSSVIKPGSNPSPVKMPELITDSELPGATALIAGKAEAHALRDETIFDVTGNAAVRNGDIRSEPNDASNPQFGLRPTSNPVAVFNSAEYGQVRIVTVGDGELWFVAADVCSILGTETRDIPSILDADEQRPLADTIHTLNDNRGLRRDSRIISEPGLFSLILRSRKPRAKDFKRWITHEVLPSIRKTGSYGGIPNFSDPVIAARAWADQFEAARKAEALAFAASCRADQLQEQALQLESKTQQLEQKIEEDRPKVAFREAVVAAKETILIGELAKLLKQNDIADVGQNRLFQYFRRHGYLHSRGGRRNQPTQKCIEAGLMVIKEGTRSDSKGETHVTMTPRITGKGQEYFVNHFLQKLRNKNAAMREDGQSAGQDFASDFGTDDEGIEARGEWPGPEKLH